ncbi:hypothetical protein MKEN_00758700 [Mycena kentingensis (nom. inval.)]|nr:hypothetical protein MKEN_00758700 [Mycena kentingensis (nom. inval.)]
MSGLVGTVFERSTTSKPSTPFAPGSSASAGFPQATHRSKKSAFARAREAANPAPRDFVPLVVPTGPNPSQGRVKDSDEWRDRMSKENELRVEAMTEEEREQDRQEIFERFGPGIADVLRRAREAREKSIEPTSPRPTSPRPDPLPPALVSPSPSGTRPSSRASKKLRFAQVTPNDVHVYDSAPPSPKKQALALLPPSANDDAVSLGSLTPQDAPPKEPEEGTPEYIRRRFFPSVPAHNPDLAWMEDIPPPVGSSGPAPSTLRFDLSGNSLAAAEHSSLPTHLGLHHHPPDEDGVQRAGYTLDDVFLMTRSGVKAQRAASMRMLVGIARWAQSNGEDDLKARILAAGIDALAERGSLGLHAVEVVCESMQPESIEYIPGVELGQPTKDIPLAHLLPQIAAALATHAESSRDAPSLDRLLAILRYLAHATNAVATEIVSTPALIATIYRTFLLSSSQVSPTNAVTALTLLTILASSSRANAQSLSQPADALLRFMTSFPPPDPALLIATLDFYKTLATYGLYSHIASTARLPLAELARYVSENTQNTALVTAWAALLESWIVCATDPHHTTPEHDIVWSQVAASGWGSDLLAVAAKLGTTEEEYGAWASVWRAIGAWLEGVRINGVRGGEQERGECLVVVKPAFEIEGRSENVVIGAVLNMLSASLEDVDPEMVHVGHLADTITAAIRLWLACLPPLNGAPLAEPPFGLPFSQISNICAKLATHPIWAQLSNCGASHARYRPLVSLLSRYLRLSKHLPDVSQDAWMAQALAILSRLLPGDEDFAVEIGNEIIDLLTPEWAASRAFAVPHAFWDKGGLAILKPFIVHIVRPRSDVYVGPVFVSPRSIKHSTTQRLPAVLSKDYAMPARRDWTLAPIDHLLRSGVSPAFQNLPASWDASEVDVTRAALLLTNICREISSRFSFAEFVLTREEAVFGCMKVFMLEHGQAHSDSAEEVFRDQLVGQLMDNLLAKYTGSASSDDLERVAASFLGASTPFYQYYTDFVALYDAISVSHHTFAKLLLPPTAMRYAVDYRRHLWNDFAHILKSIRVSPESMFGEVEEYLWPLETDAQMLGAYLRALVKDSVQGMLRLVALHHVASSIWLGDDRAEKLLKAIVEQGSHELVADVVRYHKVQGEAAASGEIGDETRKVRQAFCERVGLRDRLRGLLQ